MGESLAGNVEGLIAHSPLVALAVVWLGGVLTAANPCVLAMIPLSIAYCGGTDGATNWKRSLLYALLMVAGLSLTFAVLGVLAGIVGGAVGGGTRMWSWVIAVVCVVMGLHLMEVVTIPIPAVTRFQPETRGAAGAFMLGILFGFVSTPCAGPILLVLLAYVATAGANPLYGGALLLSYALGHSALIIVAGTSAGLARGLLSSERFAASATIARKIAGGIIVALGIWFIYKAV